MKNRMLIVTALWQRHAISEIVLNYYADLAKQPGMKLELLCCISPDDPQSRELAEAAGWWIIEHANAPLTQKFNRLFETAKSHDFELMMLVGSDDLISPELIHFYDRTVSHREPVLHGLSDLYFYSVEEARTIYFPGYNTPKTIGAGRCFPRALLDELSWRPWRSEKMNRGLDSVCSSHLKRKRLHERAYSMNHTGCVAVDIKGATTSLTEFFRVEAKGRSCEGDVLEHAFPEQMRAVRALRKEVAA